MRFAFFSSSLGKKCVMAISGGALFLFVVVHMIGNLQIFLGRDSINAYGHFLQSKPELVWGARLGMLIMAGLHVVSAALLTIENRAARPERYAARGFYKASYASRTMVMSGVILACFIVYHLLHFTAQVSAINFTGTDFEALHDGQGRHDVYGMMVIGFSNPWVSLFYVAGMAMLALHLSHGVSSMFQSIGWKDKKYGVWIDRFALTMAVALFLGYVSIPVAILAGLVTLNP